MNSDNGVGNRGEHIKPAGRRSIHCHSNYCPFAHGEVTMGGYGIGRKGQQRNKINMPEQTDPGRDEPDNVGSKFMRPISPMPIRQNQQRRKSLDDPESDNSHDFSEDSDEEPNDPETSKHSQHPSNVSNQSSSNLVYSTPLREYNYQPDSFKISPILEKQTKIETKGKDTWKRNVLITATMCILLAIFGLQNSDWLPKIAEKDIINSGERYDELKFYNDLSAVGEMYNLNQDSILQLQVGISTISEKEDTDSFMFVYNSEKNNFNSTVFNEFINNIATVSARYLRNESASVRHVVVDSSRIVVKDTDELIHKYSNDIEKGGVMVMKEIDTLPPSLAMALHYYCDVFNPLVKKSAIFFTLDVANCSDKISTHAHIEKCLKKKWSSISSEFIGPLLSRVVSVVVDVTGLF